MLWISLVLVYGLLKGLREIAKKKALDKNTVIEVLFFYTLLSFLLVVPSAGEAFGTEKGKLLPIAFKSFIIFVAWMCGFKAIKKMPISIVGILDMSRVVFSMLLALIVLKEVLSIPQAIGMLLVCAGLFALPFGKDSALKHGTKDEKKENVKPHYVLLVFISAFLNALSGTMDKVLMKDLSSGELQFWYMLFLLGFYVAYIFLTRSKIDVKSLMKNGWVWALSIMFVIADRCLFIANGIPESRVTVMTLIKQTGCIVTIIGGKLIFKEKNIIYKLICASVIIAGVAVATI